MLNQIELELFKTIPGIDKALENFSTPFFKTIEEWVKIAEKLAENNGGILPNLKWLKENKYAGLVHWLNNSPNKFSHILQPIKQKKTSSEEWVKIAEKLALENKGILPNQMWLINNKYSALAQHIRKYPEKFSHISQNYKGGKNLDEIIKLAEQLTIEHNGILPNPRWLQQNKYSNIQEAIRKYPDKFNHILQERKYRDIKDCFKLIDEIIEKNNNVIPNYQWFKENGCTHFHGLIKKNPEKYKNFESLNFKKDVSYHLKIAEKLYSEHNCVLPNVKWLRKNGYEALQSCMRAHPEKFQHLTKLKLKLSITEQIKIAEKLALENNNILPNQNWLINNDYCGLAQCIKKNPDKFKHITQNFKGGKTREEWVEIAEELSRKNDNILPKCAWLIKNGYNGLYLCMKKYPDKFSHITKK